MIDYPPLRSSTPPHVSLLRCGVVVCPSGSLGSVPFGPSVTLTPGAVSACETSLARFPNRCLSPLSSGRVSQGLRKGRFGGCRPGGADASSFLVVVAMPPSVRSRRSGAAGGALGVCREVIFVVFFGRGEVTPTTPLVGP